MSAARDGVKVAKKACDATEITAPSDGIVLFAPTVAGATAAVSGGGTGTGEKLARGCAVTPGAPVFTLMNQEGLSFTVEVDEADITKIVEGQKAEVSLDALPDKKLIATVSSVGNTAQSTMTGGTIFEVELTFDAGDAQIKLGMKGDTTIEIEMKNDIVTVPIEALFSEAGIDYVYVINADNKLVKTVVGVGVATDTHVEITKGLTDATVALAGADPLTDGLRVSVEADKK